MLITLIWMTLFVIVAAVVFEVLFVLVLAGVVSTLDAAMAVVTLSAVSIDGVAPLVVVLSE